MVSNVSVGNQGNLKVQTFVHLGLRFDEVQLNEEDIRSDKLTKLLAYFLFNRNRTIVVQELVDALWGDEENDNPAAALKNLVYRLRVFLKKIWNDVEFVKTERGGYRWNSEIEVELDAELFENLSKMATMELDVQKKLALYREALSKYEGAFLPKLADESWVANMSTYYHSLYIETVKATAELLCQEGEYATAEEILGTALLVDNLDESLYTYMIRALVQQEKYNQAKIQYEKAVDILYENLGVRPSTQLRESYEEVYKSLNVVESNIDVIQKALEEEEEEEDCGAFFCDYGVFRQAYQLEKRRMRRMDATSFVALVSLEPRHDIRKDTKVYLNMMQRGMEIMKKSLLNNLREGDVLAKYSGAQHIVLVSSSTRDEWRIMEESIQKNFSREDKLGKIKLNFSLNQV